MLCSVLLKRLMGDDELAKKTYCAFIDVRKAYDRVWRDGLWKRMWEAGVRGKMWRIIRAMYSKVSSCVLVDGEQSQWFDSMVGCVRVVFCRPYYTLCSLMVSRNLSKRREPGALQSAM